MASYCLYAHKDVKFLTGKERDARVRVDFPCECSFLFFQFCPQYEVCIFRKVSNHHHFVLALTSLDKLGDPFVFQLEYFVFYCCGNLRTWFQEI